LRSSLFESVVLAVERSAPVEWLGLVAEGPGLAAEWPGLVGAGGLVVSVGLLRLDVLGVFEDGNTFSVAAGGWAGCSGGGGEGATM
jgi:hypothetical protein